MSEANPVESITITSPESMQETRQRLSKLLARERSKRQSERVNTVGPFNEFGQTDAAKVYARSLTQSFSSHNLTQTIRHRSPSRTGRLENTHVTIKVDESDDSLSPLQQPASKTRKELQFPVARKGRDDHIASIPPQNSAESSRHGLDPEILSQTVAKWNASLESAISAAVSIPQLRLSFQSLATGLQSLSVGNIHVWLRRINNPSNIHAKAQYGISENDSINDQLANYFLDYFGNCDSYSEHLTIYPADSMWTLVTAAIRDSNTQPESHTISGRNSHLFWHAVHVLLVPSFFHDTVVEDMADSLLDIQGIDRNLPSGFVVFTESSDASVSSHASLLQMPRQGNAARIKVLLALECAHNLVVHLSAKLLQFQTTRVVQAKEQRVLVEGVRSEFHSKSLSSIAHLSSSSDWESTFISAVSAMRIVSNFIHCICFVSCLPHEGTSAISSRMPTGTRNGRGFEYCQIAIAAPTSKLDPYEPSETTDWISVDLSTWAGLAALSSLNNSLNSATSVPTGEMYRKESRWISVHDLEVLGIGIPVEYHNRLMSQSGSMCQCEAIPVISSEEYAAGKQNEFQCWFMLIGSSQPDSQILDQQSKDWMRSVLQILRTKVLSQIYHHQLASIASTSGNISAIVSEYHRNLPPTLPKSCRCLSNTGGLTNIRMANLLQSLHDLKNNIRASCMPTRLLAYVVSDAMLTSHRSGVHAQPHGEERDTQPLAGGIFWFLVDQFEGGSLSAVLRQYSVHSGTSEDTAPSLIWWVSELLHDRPVLVSREDLEVLDSGAVSNLPSYAQKARDERFRALRTLLEIIDPFREERLSSSVLLLPVTTSIGLSFFVLADVYYNCPLPILVSSAHRNGKPEYFRDCSTDDAQSIIEAQFLSFLGRMIESFADDEALLTARYQGTRNSTYVENLVEHVSGLRSRNSVAAAFIEWKSFTKFRSERRYRRQCMTLISFASDLLSIQVPGESLDGLNSQNFETGLVISRQQFHEYTVGKAQWDTQRVEAILARVEDYVAKLFPNDVVFVSESKHSFPSIHSKQTLASVRVGRPQITAVNLSEEDLIIWEDLNGCTASSHLRESSQNDPDNSSRMEYRRHVLLGVIKGYTSEGLSNGADESNAADGYIPIDSSQPHLGKVERRVLGYVRITRLQPKRNRAEIENPLGDDENLFSELESQLLKQLCELAGSIFTAPIAASTSIRFPIAMKLPDPKVIDDWRALHDVAQTNILELQRDKQQFKDQLHGMCNIALPITLKLIPAMLSASLSGNTQLLKSLFPFAAKALKRLCGGDVVLVRLLSTVFPGLSGDLFASSEENSFLTENTESLSPDLDFDSGLNDDLERLVKCEFLANTVSHGISSSSTQCLLNLMNSNHERIGEIRFVSSSKLDEHIWKTQSSVVNLIAYVLVHAIVNSRLVNDLRAELATSQRSILKLEEASQGQELDIRRERNFAADFRNRWTSALAFIVFLSKTIDASSLAQIARIVNEALPPVFNVKRVSLFVLKPGDSNSSDEFYDAATMSDLDGPENNTEYQRIVSAAFIHSLPTFPDSSTSPNLPSKLFLPSTPSGPPLTALLFFPDPVSSVAEFDVGISVSVGVQSSERKITHAWGGMEDIIFTAVKACISNCIKKVDISRSVGSIKSKLLEVDAIQAERARLADETVRLSALCTEVTESRDLFQNENDLLRSENKSLKADAERMATNVALEIQELSRSRMEIESELLEKIDSLQADISLGEQELKVKDEQKIEIMNIIHSFASDRRAQGGDVLSWLGDYAEDMHASLAFVGQQEGGKLQAPPTVERLRGAVSAAGEAVRTGQPVYLLTSFAATSSLFHDTAFSGPSSARKKRESDRESHAASSLFEDLQSKPDQVRIALYCVPNNSVLAGRASGHACFIFARTCDQKQKSDNGFSTQEKSILQCVATLAGTSLVKDENAVSEVQLRTVAAAAEAERHRTSRIRSAVATSELAWSKGMNSRLDVVNSIEAGAVHLLARGSNDPCSVQSFFWYPPHSFVSKGGLSRLNATTWLSDGPYTGVDRGPSALFLELSKHGYGSEIDIVSKLLSSGSCYRRAGLMWEPLKTPSGEIIALLRVERKLNLSDVEFGITTSWASENIAQNDTDGTLFKESSRIFRSKPSLQDLVITEEDEEVIRTFARLSFPLIDRISSLSEAMDSVRQAHQAISVLEASHSGLETKLATEIAQRLQLEEALKAGIDLLGLASGERVSPLQLLEAARLAIIRATSSEDCFVMVPPNILSNGLQVDDDYLQYIDSERNDPDNHLITFEPNQPNHTRVKLELTDLEYMARYHGRALSAPLPLDQVTQALVERTSSSEPALSVSSWTDRRMSVRASIGSGSRSPTARQPLNVIAAPWSSLLRAGDKPIKLECVLSACRGGATYSTIDKEVMLLLGSVLTHCMTVSLGALDRKEWQKTLTGLQAQVDRLSNDYGVTAGVDANLECFVDALVEDSLIQPMSPDYSGNSSASGAFTAPTQPGGPGAALAELFSIGGRSIPSANPTDSTCSMPLPEKSVGLSRGTGVLTQELLEYSMEARILSAAEFVFGSKQVSLLFATRPDIPLGDIEITPFVSSTESTKAMTVKSRFGVVNAWVDSLADSGIEASLAKTIAKLQFQYQIANLRQASSGPGNLVSPASPYFLDHSFLKRDIEKMQYEGDSILMLIKFHNRQQTILLRILPPDRAAGAANLALDKVWRLKTVLLLRLVDSEVPWIDKIAGKNAELARMETELAAMNSRMISEISLKQNEIENVNLISRESLVATKDKYKQLLKDRARMYSLGELFQVAGAAGGHNFKNAFHHFAATIRPTVHGLENSANQLQTSKRRIRSHLGQCIEQVCAIIANATRTTINVGHIITSESIEDIADEAAQTAISTDIDIIWSVVDDNGVHRKFPASKVPESGTRPRRRPPPKPTGQPVTLSGVSTPVRGRRDQSIQNSPSGSPADSIILCTADPAIQLALNSGSIVVVSADAGNRAVKRAEEYAQKLLVQASYDTKLNSSIDSDLINRAAVVITSTACGHPEGTLLIPLRFSEMNTSFVVMCTPVSVPKQFEADTSVEELRNRDGLTEQDIESPSADRSETRPSATVLSAQLLTWMMLSRSLVESVHDSLSLSNLRGSNIQKNVQQFIHRVNVILSDSKMRKLQLNRAFYKLKAHCLQQSIAEALQTNAKLETANLQLAQLERSLADWTELSKGITGTTGHIEDGIAGVWTHSSRVLINILTSQISVRGCGLFLLCSQMKSAPTMSEAVKDNLDVESSFTVDDAPGSSLEVIELALRDIGSPLGRMSQRSQGHLARLTSLSIREMPDYARAALEIRTEDDFGHQISTMIRQILEPQRVDDKTAPDNDRRSLRNNRSLGSHQIIKLKHLRSQQRPQLSYPQYYVNSQIFGSTSDGDARPDDSEEEEEIWLLPVKTATGSLAVIRLSVCPSSDLDVNMKEVLSISENFPLNTVRKPDELSSKLTSNTRSVHEVQNIGVHFASLLAPLCVAAIAVDDHRVQQITVSETLAEKDESAVLFQQELATSRKQSSVLKASLTGLELAVHSISSVSLADVGSSQEVTTTVAESWLHQRMQQMVKQLSEGLGVEITVSLPPLGVGIQSQSIHFGASDPNSATWSEPLSDASGFITFCGNHETIEVLSGQMLSSIGSGPASGSTGSQSTPPISVFKALSRMLHSFLFSSREKYAAECSLKLAREDILRLEQSVEEYKIKTAEMEASEILVQHSSEFYRSLADIINQSLLCVASMSAAAENNYNSIPSDHSDRTPNPARMVLSSALRSIGGKVAPLVGGSAMIFFALNDQTTDQDSVNLQWLAAVNEDYIRENGRHTRDIVRNLAQSVCLSGAKSRVLLSDSSDVKPPDVRTVELYPEDGSRELIVLTYPIFPSSRGSSSASPINSNMSPNTAIGILQIIASSAVAANDLDGFCEDVAAAVGCAIEVEQYLRSSVTARVSMEQEMVLVEKLKDEAVITKETLKLRTTAFELLSDALATISDVASQRMRAYPSESRNNSATSNFDTDHSLLEVFMDESVLSILTRIGLFVRFPQTSSSKAVAQFSRSALMSEELYSEPSTLTTAVATIIDEGGAAIEFCCLPPKGSSQIQSSAISAMTDVMSSEMIPHIVTLCKSIVVLYSQRKAEVAEVISQVKDSSATIDSLNDELRIVRKNLAIELDKREKLIRYAAELKEAFIAASAANRGTLVQTTEMLAEEWQGYHLDDMLWPNTSSEPSSGSSPMGINIDRFSKAYLIHSNNVLKKLCSLMPPLRYILSLLVETSVNDKESTNEAVNCMVYEMALGATASTNGEVYSFPLGRGYRGSDLTGSALGRCFKSGRSEEELRISQELDLVGLSSRQLQETFGSIPSAEGGANISLLLVPLASPAMLSGPRVVLRLLYVYDEPESIGDLERGKTSKSKRTPIVPTLNYLPRAILRPILQTASVLGSTHLRWHKILQQSTAHLSRIESQDSDRVQAMELLNNKLNRALRMTKVVCRESNSLLDPPVVTAPSGTSASSDIDRERNRSVGTQVMAVHPAALPPLVASQDVSLKLLTMVRSLLRSEGQALLLKDNTSSPPCYQVICTGSALQWPGVEAGTFGTVAASVRSTQSEIGCSLVESVMRTHKVIATKDAMSDSRYCAALDGVCANGTPLLAAPVRGRGGAVVGVVLAAKGQGSGEYVAEDSAALELCSTLGALSLYWCQGLGALHNKLQRSSNKMSQLEKTVATLKEK